MRLKEILKNKFAWFMAIVGGGIGLLYPFKNCFINCVTESQLDKMIRICPKTALISPIDYWKFPFGGCYTHHYLFILVFIILGFIVGLILYKLWRKIRK